MPASQRPARAAAGPGEIWGDDNCFNGRSMDVYIAKLRKYLKADPEVEIVNIYGKGSPGGEGRAMKRHRPGFFLKDPDAANDILAPRLQAGGPPVDPGADPLLSMASWPLSGTARRYLLRSSIAISDDRWRMTKRSRIRSSVRGEPEPVVKGKREGADRIGVIENTTVVPTEKGQWRMNVATKDRR